MGQCENSIKREKYNCKCLDFEKEERRQINNINYTLRNLGQTKPQTSIMKEVKMIRE